MSIYICAPKKGLKEQILVENTHGYRFVLVASHQAHNREFNFREFHFLIWSYDGQHIS